MSKKKNTSKIKNFLWVVYALVGLVIFIGIYLLEQPNSVSPEVFVEAEESLKFLDDNQEEAKDCAGLLREEQSWIEGFEEPLDEPVSPELEERNERILAELKKQNIEHKKECEPLIDAYNASIDRYIELYSQIKNSEKSRFVILFGGNPGVEMGPSFRLQYSLKYAIGSDRFKLPEY
ncbi:MAG: hypothetical protein PHW75_01570 [Patescibacteria group bacterium]|nr:hypothetical protein [Patescibacteria group bacterium]